MHMCLPRCLHDLFIARVQAPIPDIMQNVRMEQRRVLRNDADSMANALELQCINRLVVDADMPGGRDIEAEEQAHDGGLSAAGGTNEGDFLAGGYVEAQVLEDGTVRMISKVDVIEADGATAEFKGFRVRYILDIDIEGQDVGFVQCGRLSAPAEVGSWSED